MHKLLFIFTLLLLTSCIKESRIEIPYSGDKIVANTLIQPDSLIYIRVTSSKQVTVDGNLRFQELDSATVTMLEDGIKMPAPVWTVINGYGYFVSQSFAKEGSHYAIQVSNNGLTAVSGQDSTPVQPSISNGYAQRELNRVKFTLLEDGNATNYYRMRIYYADSVNNTWEPNRKDTIKFRLDPALNIDLPELITNEYKSEYIMTDQYFNGKTIQFVLQTEKEVTGSHMMIELSALTPAAWKYMQSTASNRLTDSQNFSLDPESVYSNVENGYGIIAGINAARLHFTVE